MIGKVDEVTRADASGAIVDLYAYVHNDPLNLTDPLGLCDNPQGCGGAGSIVNATYQTGGSSVNAAIDAAYQGRFHDQVVNTLADYLRNAGHTVATEAPLNLVQSPDIQARLDVLAQQPQKQITFGVEVKTGEDPTYTLQQRIVYPHVPVGGMVFSPSQKVIPFGFQPGAPLPPIPLYQLCQQGPSIRPQIGPLPTE